MKSELYQLSRIGALSLLLSTNVLLAGTETVTVSPDNLNKEVKFYSEYAAQMHTLTVQAASGFKFKSGPSLSLNPESLWSSTGGNSFSMIDMEDRTVNSAKVDGVLVPTGSGGGSGTPPEYPFEITMISKYFTVAFIDPDSGTTYVVKGEKTPVSVSLVNAVGAPASGSVTFSSTLGSFGLNNPATVQSGVASSELTVTASARTKAKITASASNVDITDSKTASGDKESEEYTVAEIQFVSLEAIGGSTVVTPNAGGGKTYSAFVFMEGRAKVDPPEASNAVGATVQLVQYGGGGHHYTISGTPIQDYINGGQDGDINRSVSQEEEYFTVLGDDAPFLGFSATEWSNLSSLQTLLSMNVYLQYRINSGDWKTMGRMNWFWSGGLDSSKAASGGVPDATGSANSESPVNPANPWN